MARAANRSRTPAISQRYREWIFDKRRHNIKAGGETGYGPEELVDLEGVTPPIVEPGDVVVMGYRDDPEEEGGVRETDLVDERIQLVAAPTIKRGDPERLGRYVAERLKAQAGRFWVHFDVENVDGEEMPAVT